LRCQVCGRANKRCAAAGEGAGTPGELIGIACYHPHILNLHVQLVGDDLGENCLVRLPLRAVTGCHGYLAAGADGDFAAFIRSNSSTLGEGDHTDAKAFAFGARFGLNFLTEFFILDLFKTYFEVAQIVTAIQGVDDEVLPDNTGLKG